MNNENETAASAATRPASAPGGCVYVVMKVIGCRCHYLAVNGGWSSQIDTWVEHWVSSERETAYQRAQRAGGLLIKFTREEWSAALDDAAKEWHAANGGGE